MKSKTSVQLPGQSRSIACKTKSCRRLLGHRGDHRSTLTAAAPKVPTAAAPKEPRQARKARRPKVVVLPMAEYRRLVADSRNGQLGRRAGKPKASPETTRSRSNANALKGRMVAK